MTIKRLLNATVSSPLPDFPFKIRYLPTAVFDHPPSTKVSVEWSKTVTNSYCGLSGRGEVWVLLCEEGGRFKNKTAHILFAEGPPIASCSGLFEARGAFPGLSPILVGRGPDRRFLRRPLRGKSGPPGLVLALKSLPSNFGRCLKIAQKKLKPYLKSINNHNFKQQEVQKCWKD